MSDGEDDDDKPPQGERQRQRSRSREQVYPHVQVLQVPQIQPMATPESDDEISDEDFTITNPSLSSAGTPPSAEQRIAPEEPKDLDHVTENIHVHPHMLVNNNSLLYLLSGEYSRIRQLRVKMKIQQPWFHRIVWVIIQVTTRSRRNTETGSTDTERKETYCWKAAEHTATGQEV